MAPTGKNQNNGNGKPTGNKGGGDKPTKAELKEKDLNNDGKITKADETLRRDTFSVQSLGIDYATAARIVSADQSLSDLFKKAVKEQWTADGFKAALQNTSWYTNQGTEFARKAWLAKNTGGSAWVDQLNAAKEAITAKAVSAGAVLPSNIDALAEEFLFGGWNDPARAGFLDERLSGMVDIQKGQASELTQQLKDWAWQNGQTYDDNYYKNAAASVIAGNSSAVDYKNDMSASAAATYPLYADRIAAGQSVRSLASPYIKRMSQILELDENDIKIDDPHMSKALGDVDDKGNPKATSFVDFEEKLRRDPRWMKTANGRQTMNEFGMTMMKDWGFVK